MIGTELRGRFEVADAGDAGQSLLMIAPAGWFERHCTCGLADAFLARREQHAQQQSPWEATYVAMLDAVADAQIAAR